MINEIKPKTNVKGEEITLEERFLTAKEVMKYCGVGRATIYRAMDRNEFPLSHKITLGRVGWLESDLEEYKRLGFVNFGLLYGEVLKKQRADNKGAEVAAQQAAA